MCDFFVVVLVQVQCLAFFHYKLQLGLCYIVLDFSHFSVLSFNM